MMMMMMMMMGVFQELPTPHQDTDWATGVAAR
jgi:hypothetical protein